VTRPAQLLPTQPELVKAFGDALDWCPFYEGAAREFVVDRLPGEPHLRCLPAPLRPPTAERAFLFRVRAWNARGVAGTWSEESHCSTRQVPLRCGGKVRSTMWKLALPGEPC
jgi:hypothetical protein